MFVQEIRWSKLATAAVVALLAAVAAGQLVALGALAHAAPAAGAASPLVGLAVLAFATASLAWFHRLRVTVDEARLTLGFGPIRRQVALDRIERARPVTYRALTWGGWGIRWRPGTGTLWNVPGDGGRAVELTLRDGRLLLFSSPDPDAAVAAIEAARSAGR